ncbi:BOI-related E3 ubiquitin-protein ligase 3 [Spatholobus suberectus]|nr:BOI-related E3 ubiquitin-protein ligase 3 [Spatholobus suberectus]
MAIEAQLYPNNAAFPLCGSKNLMIDSIPSCLNSQACSLKHHAQSGEQQCLQHLHHARQMNQNMSLVDPSFSSFYNSNVQNAVNKHNHNVQPLASYPQSLAIEFDEQSEIDRYIRSQNEKLRILLQEQRRQEVAELLKKVESNALYLLRQKDEEIAQATKKTTELKEFLRRLEVENQWWRKIAQENEAMVLSLHNTLEQMKERALYRMTTEDAESCCDDNMRNTAMEEEKGQNSLCRGGVGEVEQIRKKTMNCKCCNSQNCVLCFFLAGTFVRVKLVRLFCKFVLSVVCPKSLA